MQKTFATEYRVCTAQWAMKSSRLHTERSKAAVESEGALPDGCCRKWGSAFRLGPAMGSSNQISEVLPQCCYSRLCSIYRQRHSFQSVNYALVYIVRFPKRSTSSWPEFVTFGPCAGPVPTLDLAPTSSRCLEILLLKMKWEIRRSPGTM